MKILKLLTIFCLTPIAVYSSDAKSSPTTNYAKSFQKCVLDANEKSRICYDACKGEKQSDCQFTCLKDYNTEYKECQTKCKPPRSVK